MVTIVSETDDIPVPTEPLQEMATKIITGENVNPNQNIDLIFCSEETIQNLNREYRNKDSVTDVLSYPFGDDDYLGEIYICTKRAQEQAEEYNFTLLEETLRLLVHGLFHLQGYDHMTEEERIVMEAKEKEYFTID